MAYECRGDTPVKYPDTENSGSPVKDLGLALELQLLVRKILLALFQPRVPHHTTLSGACFDSFSNIMSIVSAGAMSTCRIPRSWEFQRNLASPWLPEYYRDQPKLSSEITTLAEWVGEDRHHRWVSTVCLLICGGYAVAGLW